MNRAGRKFHIRVNHREPIAALSSWQCTLCGRELPPLMTTRGTGPHVAERDCHTCARLYRKQNPDNQGDPP